MLLIGTLLPEAAEGQAGRVGAAQGLGRPLWEALGHTKSPRRSSL